MKRDIRFINYDSVTQEFTFDWSSSTTDIKGRDKLVQDIVKRILTARGSNVFDPEYGEEFYRLFGTIDPSREQEIQESFPVLLRTMQEDIIAEQSLDDTLTSSEKLLSLKLNRIEFDVANGAWIIDIEVQTQDRVKSFFTID